MPGIHWIRVRALLFAVFLGLGSQVDAQVDCGNPDNLCTGDPCIIPSLEVALPCVVDFGPRTVVVAGRLRASEDSPGSPFSLTAGTIEVRGGINTRSGLGVTLNAAQDIIVTGRIGRSRVTMIAGGNITHEGRIFVDGAILDAGGTLRTMGRIRGGSTLRGVEGVQLLGGSVKTPFSGNVEISSDAGEVTIDVPVQGVKIVIEAAGSVVLSKRVTGVERLEVSSASGDITVSGPIHIYASVDLTAVIAAAGTVRLLDHTIYLDGSSGETSCRIEGSAVEVGPAATIRSHGFTNSLRLLAAGGDLTLAGRFKVIAHEEETGVIEGTASGNVTASGEFTAERSDTPNGCISFTAGGTLDTSGGTFNPPLSADCPGSPSGAFLEAQSSLWE